jgi:hypothetical protein
MPMNCPVCRVEVIQRHNKCPWCDHRFPVVLTPDVPVELERAYEATILHHAYPHPTKATP